MGAGQVVWSRSITRPARTPRPARCVLKYFPQAHRIGITAPATRPMPSYQRMTNAWVAYGNQMMDAGIPGRRGPVPRRDPRRHRGDRRDPPGRTSGQDHMTSSRPGPVARKGALKGAHSDKNIAQTLLTSWPPRRPRSIRKRKGRGPCPPVDLVLIVNPKRAGQGGTSTSLFGGGPRHGRPRSRRSPR